MLSEWRKFRGWAVLEFFLSQPSAQVHIKQLARELDISPQTANYYLRLYEAEGLLVSEPVGNLVRFRLDNSLPLARELKRSYACMLLHESTMPTAAEKTEKPEKPAAYAPTQDAEPDYVYLEN